MDILSKANSTIVEYDNIMEEIMDPSNVLDQEKLATLSKQKSAIQEVYDLSLQFVTLTNENKELDNYNKTGWGTKETTKRWVESTPGQVMPDVKPTPKSKTRTRKHPGNEVSDAGGMGEGAVKRGLLPSQDNFGPGMSKADHSNAKVSDTTYKPKPDDLITKIKGARKSAKVLLKGSKND